MSKKRNGHATDKRGRRKTGDRFVKLEHFMLRSSAWLSLSPAPRALYLQLAYHYNGWNNGEISMSVRQAAGLLHIAKDTASKAFWELEEKGFIRRNVCGSFDWKARHATTWILTVYPLEDDLATKDFMRWVPPEIKAGPKSGTSCPCLRTLDHDFLEVYDGGVLQLGPCAECCNWRRSQTTARIYYTIPYHTIPFITNCTTPIRSVPINRFIRDIDDIGQELSGPLSVWRSLKIETQIKGK